MSEQSETPLHTLLVRAAVVLEDLADDVREQTVTDQQYAQTAELLQEVAELLRGQNVAYVPPRVVDAERAGR